MCNVLFGRGSLYTKTGVSHFMYNCYRKLISILKTLEILIIMIFIVAAQVYILVNFFLLTKSYFNLFSFNNLISLHNKSTLVPMTHFNFNETVYSSIVTIVH